MHDSNGVLLLFLCINLCVRCFNYSHKCVNFLFSGTHYMNGINPDNFYIWSKWSNLNISFFYILININWYFDLYIVHVYTLVGYLGPICLVQTSFFCCVESKCWIGKWTLQCQNQLFVVKYDFYKSFRNSLIKNIHLKKLNAGFAHRLQNSTIRFDERSTSELGLSFISM